MNLLRLTHMIGERRLSVDSLAELIVQAIDDDTSVPIDGWDMSASVHGPEGVTYQQHQFDTVENVAVLVSEWGYSILAKTETGELIQWIVTLVIAGGPHEEEDDDPVCVCGVYQSEHALCGCPDGFQRASTYKGYEPDVDDDFPMSVEYDGLYGAPDFLVEQTAQDEAMQGY